MPKIAYEEHRFGSRALEMIEKANEIIAVYAAQGFDLTLRQLYYQFVARDLLPNRQREYKRLGAVVSAGRRAGLIDWDAIVDRTRALRGLSHWASPAQIIAGAARSFNVDHWAPQPHYVEVWIEKDALAGVFERVCNLWDVPFFSCRGYTSDSEMWSAGRRLDGRARQLGKGIVVLHFGDHDPSGIDMTRDIRDRLELFTEGRVVLDVRRLALNMDQVQEYGPPPNPAKETDSRFAGYIAEYGAESWELDALDPAVLAGLVEREVRSLLNMKTWRRAKREQEAGRVQIRAVADRWDGVLKLLGEPSPDGQAE